MFTVCCNSSIVYDNLYINSISLEDMLAKGCASASANSPLKQLRAHAGPALSPSARRCCSLDAPIYGDLMSTPEEPIPQLTIRRDSTKHAWVLVGGAADGKPLPWSDEAPAISVVLWLKTQMNGRVKVAVEL